jgi:RNA polymerase sigma-70 factor (ECF subfamily)
MNKDTELIDNFIGGSQDAFQELVERHQGKVYNIAYRMLGNVEDAQDLTQEAFVKVYHALADFRGDSTFSTWLYRIVTNLCYDYLRRNRPTYSLNEPLQTETGELHRQLPTAEDGPEEITEQKELQRLLQKLINTLPEQQRSVLVLREFRGLTYEEIALTLECSLGTVKSRLFRARNSLKERLVASGEPFGFHLRHKVEKGGVENEM